MKVRYYNRRLGDEIYNQLNTYGAMKLAKQAVTEASWEEEKLETMRAIIRAKSKCVPEYRRKLMKSEDIGIQSVHGDNLFSYSNKNRIVKRTLTARKCKLGAHSKPSAGGLGESFYWEPS